jgi:4-alpha-glucanotransferase
LLGFGAEARMNIPGTASGNWSWRFSLKEAASVDWSDLGRMLRLYGRHR